MTGNIDADLIAEATDRFMRLRESGDEPARAALRHWMAMDVRHAAAIDLVECGWSNAGVLAPVPAAPWPRRHPNARHPRSRRRSVSLPWLGWATGLAAAITILIGAEHRGVGFGWPHSYATRGVARDIALVDGSLMRLQPHSRATVRLSLVSRDIALVTGGGAFIVAHEPSRPFIVHAVAIGVEATGTRFSVATRGAGLHIALWHGGVRLRDRPSDVVLAYMKPGDRADVGAGGQLVVTHPRSVPQSPARVFMFDDTPLSDAVAQIAAGTGQQIRFARPGLARLPVDSVYHGDDLAAFLDDLEAVEPICWHRRGATIDIVDGVAGCAARRSGP